MANRRKRRKLNVRGISVLLLAFLAVCLALFFALDSRETEPQTETAENATKTEESTTSDVPEVSSKPTVTKKHVTATASLGVVGDILIHEKVYLSAKVAGGGDYDFTENYEYVKSYLSKFDYTVANLEVTLGGKNPVVGSYPNAYPSFNSPDSVVDALKGAGVDLLLTANNHSYDTRAAGMARTLEVLREKGVDALGTREKAEDPSYLIKDVNGIQLGMACYTYSTVNSDGTRSLNGIKMNGEASRLVSAFSTDRLNEFYGEAERVIAQMKTNGAEMIVFYMHWGVEYQSSANSTQKEIARKLCELGVDVIIGGHPHVVQPFEKIVAENGNETYCIYSVGNFLSNQCMEEAGLHVYGGKTEDGLIFDVTFEKWSDGEVKIAEIDILPTWVIRTERGSAHCYRIIPLDLAVSDWKSFGLTAEEAGEAKDSYERTMKTVGSGLNQVRAELGLSAKSLTVN